MKAHRICTNCLYVLKPNVPKYGEDKEENSKLDVIDANIKCPKCNAHLTKYIHKVLSRITDGNLEAHQLTAEEVFKMFGVNEGNKKALEAKQTSYIAAKQLTEEQLEKDIEKYQGRKAVLR